MDTMKRKCLILRKLLQKHPFLFCYSHWILRQRHKAWFQFDDEKVTKIKTLGDKRSSTWALINIEDEDNEGHVFSL